jgi:hypothetical protein
MRVFVNEQEVNISLQGENNAREVVNGLLAWLAQEGFGATAISIHGNDILFIHDWPNIPLQDLGDIHVQAAPIHPLRIASIQQLTIWAEALHKALENVSQGHGSISTVLSLIGEYESIQGPLAFLALYDSAPHRLLGSELKHRLDNHIADCTREDGSFNADELPDFAGTVYNLAVVCRDRYREMESPQTELQRTAIAIQGLTSDLGSIGTLLQTGQAKEAFTRIYTFSEILSKLLRLFWIASEQGDIHGKTIEIADLSCWNTEASDCLQEIQNAIHSQDTVMLGDLLEYEVPPLVQKVLELIPATE